MKKIKLFLKQHSSKIIATVLCVFLLIPCFSLYAFAADDDTSSSYTDSFTDVWTGIGNWIVQSIGSVQGVFYDSTGISIMTILNPDRSIVYDGSTFYVALDPEGSLFDIMTDIYINGIGFNSDLVTENTVSIDNVSYDATFLGDELLFLTDTVDYSVYVNSAATIGAPGGLTFLGTLAVIAVAIALILLLIMVIHRFLSLRS